LVQKNHLPLTGKMYEQQIHSLWAYQKNLETHSTPHPIPLPPQKKQWGNKVILGKDNRAQVKNMAL